MSTEPQRTCPTCGNELSGAAEFCPVCLLRKGLAGGVESGESSVSEDTLKLTPGQPPQRFEHYELVLGDDGKPVELGRGAMGVTYKAFDVDLRCPVALKVISEKYLGDESARLRFLREARAAARLRHSNVASVLHLGRTGSSYFYAMEFVEGETLEKLIKRSGKLEIKLALDVKTQEKNVKTLASYLGRNVQDVLKGLGKASLLEDKKQIAAKALTQLQAGLKAGETVYAGGASLWGFVRGGISANVYFGDSGSIGSLLSRSVVGTWPKLP
jgi:Protein kinase domain